VRFTRLLTLLGSVALIALRSASGSTDIPFVYRSGMIWLNVAVPGHQAPLHFLLDSGASQSILDLRTAKRLSVKLGCCEAVEGVQGCCDAFHAGSPAGATVGGVPVPANMLALDLSSVSAASGSHIDGLLGADFFRNHIVQIDFAAQKIRLLCACEVPASGQAIPIARRNDSFCIRVAVNGNKAQWMRLDTGFNGALEWVVPSAMSRRMNLPSIAAGTGSVHSIRTEVSIGDEHFPAVKTGVHQKSIFSGEGGLVGNGLLSQFRVTIDATKGSRLLLTPAR
jgi:predicted aspartyl protease